LAATGVDTILKQVRRRHLTNLALEQLALTIGVGAGGAVLLLLLGTQVLDWYWPVVLALIGLAGSVYRTRHRIHSDYSLARIVDSRLSLQDRVSTVYYFRNVAGSAPDSIATVEQQAESRLNADDAVHVIPMAFPREGYAAAVLVLMCGGMLGLRYGLLSTLDLSKPLAQIDLNPFDETPNVQASTKKSVIQERLEEQLKQLGMPVDDLPQSDRDDALQPQQENISAVPSPEGELEPGEKGQSTGEKAPSGEGEKSEDGEKGESSTGDPDAKESADGDPGPQSKPQTPPNAPKKPNQSGEQNSGLMDKMKDAFANLLNKLKSPSRDQQQTASNENAQQQGSQQTPGQKGMQSPSRSQAEGQPSPDQQGDREGEGDQVPGNQNRAGDKNAERPGDESKTGMGKQDGSKEIQEAEQLAAMGKISEIFGKRAQQITGEMTIEVPSGKQQLKTAYTDKQAVHSGVGADVNRDEIPLAYQSYIQRYFEEVRKLPAKPKGPAAPAGTAPQAPGTLAR
jgi:hypothetical protein